MYTEFISKILSILQNFTTLLCLGKTQRDYEVLLVSKRISKAKGIGKYLWNSNKELSNCIGEKDSSDFQRNHVYDISKKILLKNNCTREHGYSIKKIQISLVY